MATKQIQELLQRAVIEWKSSNILMQWTLLYRIYSERDDLNHLNDDELLCLLLSNIEENYQTKYWIKREPERSLQILSPFVLSEQQNLVRRRSILASLRQIGDAAIPFLTTLLVQPNNALKKDAIEILEQINSAAAIHALQSIFQEREEWEKQRRKKEAERLRLLDEQIYVRLVQEAESQKLINANWSNPELENLKRLEREKDIDGIVEYLSASAWAFRWAAVDALERIGTERALEEIQIWRKKMGM